jgi:hypothetical protein
MGEDNKTSVSHKERGERESVCVCVCVHHHTREFITIRVFQWYVLVKDIVQQRNNLFNDRSILQSATQTMSYDSLIPPHMLDTQG